MDQKGRIAGLVNLIHIAETVRIRGRSAGTEEICRSVQGYNYSLRNPDDVKGALMTALSTFRVK